MAVNHPIQGTAADLMKMAMIEVDRVIARADGHRPEAIPPSRKKPILKPGDSHVAALLGMTQKSVRMILQVHDELVLEVKKGLEDEVGQLVKDTMEQVVKLRVPVKVEVKVGKNWGEMEKFL